MEYLNVTDSNTAYPQVLNSCEGVECPFDKFTSMYQSCFPGSVDAECSKNTPPTPPSELVLFIN